MFVMDEVTLSYITFVLAVIPIISECVIIGAFITSILYSRLQFYKKPNRDSLIGDAPGVSIIKPLMGLDNFLETNLESHFLISYPKFELLFCVQDDQDPAINVVNKFMERYPKVDAKIFLGGKDGVINPMVHNMAPGYENAKYDLVWVSTSRIKATTDLLYDMVIRIQDPKCALVHQMPYTTDQKGLAATVEKVYFGTALARMYVAVNVWGFCCVTGMSYLVKKTELDKVHGLVWYGKYLAEDFFLSQALHSQGFRHRVASVPAQQNVASTSIAAYKDRMVRWLRLRMNMMPVVAGFIEPMIECFALGVYMSWSVYHFFALNPYIFFGCHVLVWIALDYILIRGVQGAEPLPFSIPEFVVAWFIRELLTVWVYFEALFNVRHIRWGKRRYRLSLGGHTEIVSDKSVLPL
ncbi:ceramide glucosyltransferase-B-like isoform X2 [Lineus longissimus]